MWIHIISLKLLKGAGQALTFTGVSKAEMLTGGDTYLKWIGTDPNPDSIKIYVRAGSSSVFTDDYWVKTVKYSLGETIISLDASGVYLVPGTIYYVGVRSVTSGVEDSNTVTIAFGVTQNNIHFKLPVNSFQI